MRAVIASICIVPTLLALLASPAEAWDRTGHLVVARIAWEELSPETREAAAALLSQAPADSSLPQLLPRTSRPLLERRAEHFQLAAYWPDMVRDTDFPERHARYHRGNWHYINFFFEQRGPERTPHERTDLEPQQTNVVERLEFLGQRLGDLGVPESERAIALAWILHLVGDLHQPLHATARVTELEPQGDRGGNLFSLGRRDNLHSFWDGILRSSNTRWWFQREDGYIRRIAESIRLEHPRAGLADRAADLAFDRWGRESFEIARDHLYPAELERDQKPPRSYYDQAVRLGRERVALAGYRLATLLETRLD